jgi:prophage DNA circulation protein
MWERKTDKAKWNGRVLHIQSTTLDGGKRLHISEMPYQDNAHIKVMGAKSRSVSIEAVFVGVNSLVDANALVAELESNSEGSLEHPYLGELSLVFETSSQKFSTKKGLVTLSLKFIKQGTSVVLTRLDVKPVRQLALSMIEESNKQFVIDVEQASSEQVDAMKFDFTTVLNVLRNIANRAPQSSFKLARLHRQIEDGFTAVAMLSNAPDTYSAHFSAIVDSLKNVSEERESTNSSEFAIDKLSKAINSDVEFVHHNVLISVAMVLLSDELELLSHVESVDITMFSTYPLSKMQQNIRIIQRHLNDRVNEVCKDATYESLGLVDAVEALRENVNNQANKLKRYQQTLKEIEVVSTRPLLCIAQSNECSGDELTRLNSIAHPLFVTGILQVKHG